MTNYTIIVYREKAQEEAERKLLERLKEKYEKSWKSGWQESSDRINIYMKIRNDEHINEEQMKHTVEHKIVKIESGLEGTAVWLCEHILLNSTL